jgi:hypothetical protein
MLDVGANPRTASTLKASNSLSDGDLRTYRTLLARSDEFRDGDREHGSREGGGPEVVRQETPP